MSIFVIILIIISISQIFTIPPYSEDMYKAYKSGYYTELDRGFNIIKDAFVSIKTMTEPGYGWIFISEMEKKYGFKIKIYDDKGLEIMVPGEKGGAGDEVIQKIVNSPRPEVQDKIIKDRYFSAIPVVAERNCRFCHRMKNPGDLIGIITFERSYDSHIYYSSERILIFIFVTFILSIFLFIILKWNPGKKIKEMFDN